MHAVSGLVDPCTVCATGELLARDSAAAVSHAAYAAGLSLISSGRQPEVPRIINMARDERTPR